MGNKAIDYLNQAWLVILLAIFCGGGLAGVQIALGARIAENKKNETYEVIPALVPGAVIGRTEEILMAGKAGKEIVVYQAQSNDGIHLGWVVPAFGQGFADRIELLIAVDAQVTRIEGIYVLGQKETPGLGDYITGKDFREKFVGRPTGAALTVVRNGAQGESEIDAITGATISSESVVKAVNDALEDMGDVLRNPNAQQGSP